MSEINERLDRLESLVEQQQETIEEQRERIEQQQEMIDELQSPGGHSDDGNLSITRRGALKAAGLVGLAGAGTGAAAASGPRRRDVTTDGDIGSPSDPVDTVYVNELAAGVTPSSTPVSSLVGDGLTVSSGAVSVDVNAGDVGAAADPHGNGAHTETFAVDGDAQPPESHGNEAHSKNFGAEGETNTWTATNEFTTGLVVPNSFPNESTVGTPTDPNES